MGAGEIQLLQVLPYKYFIKVEQAGYATNYTINAHCAEYALARIVDDLELREGEEFIISVEDGFAIKKAYKVSTKLEPVITMIRK